MFLPKPEGGNFAPAPAGNHVAICYRLIDLGTQLFEWKGATRTQRKVLVSWELPNEIMTVGDFAGQPFTIGRRYTWSMSEKANLRHDLESWRGRAFTDDDFIGPKRFNAKNILGKPCMLSIVHETRDGSMYANIKTVAAVPKGLAVPPAFNPPVYFSLEREFFDASVLEIMNEKLKTTIMASPEYSDLINGRTPGAVTTPIDLDDDIPF